MKKLLIILTILSSVAFGQSGTRNLRTTDYTKAMLQLSNEADLKAYINLESGSDFQAWNPDLDWRAANLNSYWKNQLALTTLADGGVLLGSGTGAVTAMSVLTDGQFIVDDVTITNISLRYATSHLGIEDGDF